MTKGQFNTAQILNYFFLWEQFRSLGKSFFNSNHLKEQQMDQKLEKNPSENC